MRSDIAVVVDAARRDEVVAGPTAGVPVADRRAGLIRSWGGAVLLCTALAVFHTWPLASAPARLSLNYNADAELNAWIVSWVAHALPTQPLRLFAGNIFQPDDHALAYSEPLIAPALVGAPIRWLGGSPVLTFNLLLILGLAATALAGWWLVWQWTGSWPAAATGAALMAFNEHLLNRLPHLQAAHAWGLVLVLYFADRLVSSDGSWPLRPRPRRAAVLLAASLAAVALTSVYWLFFAGLIALIVAVVSLVWSRSSKGALAIVLSCAAGMLVAAPALLPYVRLAAGGARRPLEDVAMFAATLGGYFVSTSRMDAAWTRPLFTTDVNVLFAGVVALALAGVGAWAALARGGETRRRALTLIVLSAVSILLSLGPSTKLYVWLYGVVVPLQGLRAVSRFGFLFLMSVAVFAGFGVGAIAQWLRPRVPALAVGVVALVAVTIEARHAPIQTLPFNGIPRIYAALAAEPDPVLLAEVPFYPPQAVFENAEYVLNATAHWKPIMNGYSGLTPDAYRRQAAAIWFFPEDWAIVQMKKEGATHVMVHLERFGPEADAVRAALAPRRDLQLLAEDAAGHRLYRVVASQ